MSPLTTKHVDFSARRTATCDLSCGVGRMTDFRRSLFFLMYPARHAVFIPVERMRAPELSNVK